MNKLRKLNYKAVILILFAAALSNNPLFSQQNTLTNPINPNIKIYSFRIENTTDLITLDSTIIDIDSLSVTENSIILSEPDFTFDPKTSRVMFRNPLRAGIELRVFGITAPVAIGKAYYSREMRYADSTISEISGLEQIISTDFRTQEIDDSQLYKSGSITRALSFGTNRGLELSSGLNMQILGKIGSDYDIKAVLTDQNTPLQPEGNTRTLSEIDKVFINMSGPRFNSQFGDLYLNNNKSLFGSYNRKLKGVSASTYINENNVSVSFASGEGIYRSLKIQGVEGNQGPYLLTGLNGERDIIIISGTEKVYIDGVEMLRGEKNDYTIDYAAGQLIFTRNRLITADSRIVADYLYSDQNYKKEFYNIILDNSDRQGNLKYSFSLIRESDNKDRPIALQFADEDIEILSEAGDNKRSSYRSSVKFVGSGQGNYMKITEGDFTYYIYADSSDYNIIFSDVGEGNGDYSFVRLGVYEYSGENKGRFLPVIPLALPESQTLSSLNLNYNNLFNKINISAEYAYSINDINTFSSIDDNDNNGDALFLNFNMLPADLRINNTPMGKFALKSDFRHSNRNFAQLDRTTEVEFDRKWDLENQFVTGETLFEIEGEYKVGEVLSIKPGLGIFENKDGFSSDRKSLELNVSRNNRSGLTYNYEDIESETKIEKRIWNRQKAGAFYFFKGFTPSLMYEGERKQIDYPDDSEYNFDDWSGKLQYEFNSNLLIYTQYQIRDHNETGSINYQPSSKARNTIYHAEMNIGRRLNTRLHLVNRIRDYRSTGEKVNTDLADFNIQSTEFNGILNSMMNFQFSTEKIPSKELIYILVEEGRGNYSFDEQNNEFFPDPEGDYEKRIYITDKLTSINKKKVGLSLEFKPSRYRQNILPDFLNNISSSTVLHLEDNEPDSEEALNTNKFMLMNINQDIFLFESNEKFNLRLRQKYRKLNNNQYISRSEESKYVETSVRILSRINNDTSLESNIGYFENNKMIDTGFKREYKISTFKSDLKLNLRFLNNWRSSISFAGAVQNDSKNPQFDLKYYIIIPGFEKGILTSGRIRGEVEYFKVISDNSNYLPYDFAEGNQPGNNFSWNFSIDYRTSKNLLTSVKYTGSRKTRYDRTINNLRAELQVLF
ncbi:hypothetical protein ACFL7D_02860 [candidate division KSB1 bacterium]